MKTGFSFKDFSFHQKRQLNYGWAWEYVFEDILLSVVIEENQVIVYIGQFGGEMIFIQNRVLEKNDIAKSEQITLLRMNRSDNPEMMRARWESFLSAVPDLSELMISTDGWPGC